MYPRTNKQNQKKKRKVDPPTQQVMIGSLSFHVFFFLILKYPDSNWGIGINLLRRSRLWEIVLLFFCFLKEMYHNLYFGKDKFVTV